MKAKKTLSVVLILSMLSLLVAGCSGDTTASSSEASSGSASTASVSSATDTSSASASASAATDGELEACEISLITRALKGEGGTKNEIQFQFLNQWMEANPQITIVNESVFDEEQFNNKLKVAVASGEIPTIMSGYGGGAFKTYPENGVVMDLTPFLDANPEYRDDVIESAWETVTYDDLPGIYGLPSDMFTTVIFYNKTMFEEAGLEVPKTIEEFEAVCDAFLAQGITPLSLADKSPYRGGHIMGDIVNKMYGPEFAERLANREVKYTDPEMVEAFTLLKSWNDKGYFGANVVTEDVEAERSRFRTGEQPMLHHLYHNLGDIMKDATISWDEVGVMKFPYFSDKPEHENVWHSGVNGIMSIGGDATEAEAAAAFDLITYIYGNECDAAQAEAVSGAMTFARKSSQMPADSPAVVGEFVELYGQATGMAKEAGEYDTNPAVRNSFRDQIQAMLAGASPETVLNEIQTVIDLG